MTAPHYIISATGTDIGKTLTSALLMLGLDANYWKPVQCGEPHDRKTVQTLTQLPDARFHVESYVFKAPASPHTAAEIEGVVIDECRLVPPKTPRTLLIEGAGGLMVPLTRGLLMIDFFKSLNAPVILCARTELGTINHTLLSIEALKQRDIPLHGLVFLGKEHPDTMRTILDFSGARQLGHIPPLNDFSPATLRNVFDTNFRKEFF